MKTRISYVRVFELNNNIIMNIFIIILVYRPSFIDYLFQTQEWDFVEKDAQVVSTTWTKR